MSNWITFRVNSRELLERVGNSRVNWQELLRVRQELDEDKREG
jgi:hypothetical protein